MSAAGNEAGRWCVRVGWSWPGSNRLPPPCKGGALPDELQPRLARTPEVGLGRIELPTPRLSGVCSSRLSYRPLTHTFKEQARRARSMKTGPHAYTDPLTGLPTGRP